VAKVDVKGAYIQTELTGLPVYMKMDKKLTAAVVSILDKVHSFLTQEGTLYTRLKKALYVCIQSSQLWYEQLMKVLGREAYVQTPTEPCLLLRAVQGMLFILMLYVDDILILDNLEEIDRIASFMTKEFQWITISKENKQSYLGMNICVEEHKVTVDMIFFVEELLHKFELKFQPTPAVKECYTISEKRDFLTQEQRKKFQTITAKLLYLAKKAKPDILTATSFLCIRVKEPMKSNQNKLVRVIG
jgi:hypothetical protein